MKVVARLGLYARNCDAVFVLLTLPHNWESRQVGGQTVKPAERGIKHDRAEPLWFATADERDGWMVALTKSGIKFEVESAWVCGEKKTTKGGV
jgi:hypothetical protein